MTVINSYHLLVLNLSTYLSQNLVIVRLIQYVEKMPVAFPVCFFKLPGFPCMKSNAMKSDMLFGVKFMNDIDGFKAILEHYIVWKMEKAERVKQELEAITMKFGENLGLSPQEVMDELQKYKVLENLQFPDFREVTELMTTQNCRQYYVTEPVLNMSSKIKVKEPFDLEWLSPVQDGVKQYNFGNNLIRYGKTGDRMVVLAVAIEKIDTDISELKYTFFNLDLDKNKISGKHINDDYDARGSKVTHDDFDASSRKLFFQLITFMELAEIQQVVVAPGRKHGTKKQPDNLLNTGRFPITIVNTNWNKKIITEGFPVDGHLRKQAWGPSFSKRRLIWIDPFEKKGYNLEAGKLKDQKLRGPRR